MPLESLHFYYNIIYTNSELCATSEAKFSNLSTFLGDFGINQRDLMTCTSPPDSLDPFLVGFCQGSASVPRGFVSVELGAEIQSQCENTTAVVDTGRATPLMGDQCDSMLHL